MNEFWLAFVLAAAPGFLYYCYHSIPRLPGWAKELKEKQ